MAAPYEPPAWAAGGANVSGLSLDVIRNGVLVESLALPLDPAKSFVVAGRMEPLCDLVLQHPSLSRVHAVLQFDATGALFLQDMKSTHGTFVNKKRLAPLRFTRLHVGDMVVFGESTRKYAVCGPEELRPEEPDMARLRAKIQQAKQAERAREERETAGASWGFREDAEEEEDDEEDSDEDKETAKKGGRGDDDDLPEYLRGLREPGRGGAYESSVKQSDVSDKDQKLFTQLQNKIAKLGNLETEKARILAKQNDLPGGLSEGQQKTLERNNARIESLAKEIAELEDRIHARNAQRDQSRASQRKAAPSKAKAAADAYAYDSDEDDFYDRTSANQKKLSARKQAAATTTGDAKQSKSAAPAKKTEVLTAEIIQAKIRMLESDLKDLNAEYARVEADTEGGGDKNDEGAALDALEAFMQSTAKELHAKELARVRTRREEVETELKKQRQLLAIAMPALRNEQPPAVSSAPSSTPVAVKEAESSTKPASPAATTQVAPAVAEKTTRNADALPGAAEPQAKQIRRPRDETETPPVVEKSEEQPTAAPPKKRRVIGPTLPPPVAVVKKAAADPSTLEGGDRVWVPPANQTGDGRTKLNDKYGY